MIVEAEFDEIEETFDELDLAQEDGLPWLEPEEEYEGEGEIDTAQIVGFVAVLLVFLVGAFGLVYAVSNFNRGPQIVADGSTIEAPAGPVRERPQDAGGKQFAGTGDVAPGVGQGESSEARLASGAGAGSGDLSIAMPAIEGGAGVAPVEADPAASVSSSPAAPAAQAPAPDMAGAVGVQLAAYSSRARAEKGWRDLQRQSSTLSQYKHRVVEGRIDIGTVYRLQAVAADRSQAEALCRTLKEQGLDCQVKF